MQVFHFVSARYGLDDIRNRRLKIALIPELNDPFELMSIDLSDAELRPRFRSFKATLSKDNGLLCFSSKWSNPVLWSHYAERHRGLCLGFQVRDDIAKGVSYTAKRLIKEAEAIRNPGAINEALVQRLLFTKFAHWRYESEVRAYVHIDQKDSETGHYFYEFSDSLSLTHVILGCQSEISRAEVSDALGDIANNVHCFKARMAFKSFKIVRNRNESLWT